MSRIAGDADERRAMLQSLLNLDRPLAEIKASLASLGWDYPDELALLTADHIEGILQQFCNGELDARTVEDWANLIEFREDIGYRDGADGALRNAIHVLANPILTEPLNQRTAAKLLGSLST